jgi:hypothetical protein
MGIHRRRSHRPRCGTGHRERDPSARVGTFPRGHVGLCPPGRCG